MKSLKIPYPPEVLRALQKEPEEFEEEARLLLALKLYETGKLSTGLAAKLAGVPRETFLFLLGRHGLSPYGEKPEELERDLENAQRAHHLPSNKTGRDLKTVLQEARVSETTLRAIDAQVRTR